MTRQVLVYIHAVEVQPTESRGTKTPITNIKRKKRLIVKAGYVNIQINSPLQKQMGILIPLNDKVLQLPI
jgi:hypothetical protein